MNNIAQILKCPYTEEGLLYINDASKINAFLQGWKFPILNDFKVEEGFVNKSNSWFFPIINNIILLYTRYGIPLSENGNVDVQLSFDKERVFNYYKDIDYIQYNDLSIYSDSGKWVDYRPVAKDYIENSLSKARKFIPAQGEYLLDAGSGPIGLKQYLDLSIGYECRICCDISFAALQQAQINLKTKGLFICCDVTNLPIKSNICDAVVSQHVIYHIPKSQQKRAIEEFYRVAKPGHRVVVVYSYFYHSALMNITIFPIQLYRILRHFGGKIFVRFSDKKPRLYFYAHGRRFFRNLSFSKNMKIYSWRSLNIYFLRTFVHKGFGGKQILTFFKKLEDKYPEFMGRIGEYPIIVITKT